MAEKRKLSKLEREATNASEFIKEVMDKLDIAYNNGQITKTNYVDALAKLDTLSKDVGVLEQLNFQIQYNKELESEKASELKELEATWNEYYNENKRIWEENLNAAQDQINVLMKANSKNLEAARKKYDPENLSNKIQELEGKLAEKDGELAEVRTHAEKDGKKLNEAEEQIAQLQEIMKKNEFNTRKLANLQDSQKRAQSRIVKLNKEIEALKESEANNTKKIGVLEAEIEEKTQEIEKCRATIAEDEIEIARCRDEIAKYEGELALVEGRIEDIRRNVIQAYLCKEFGLTGSATAGIERAKALGKAMKKAKRDKTYTEKLESVANSLKSAYPHVFDKKNEDEQTAQSDSLYNTAHFDDEKQDELYDEVEKTLKSTVYRVPRLLKGIAICASALLVATIFVGGAKMLSYAETIRTKDENITTVETERDSANADKEIAQKNAYEATTNLKTAEDKIGALEAENEQLKQNQQTQVQEKQDFVFGQGEVDGKTASIIKERARGNIQNVAFSYNSNTGDIIMVAEVEKEGDYTLVVGEGFANVGCQFDSESIQKLASSMTFKTFNNKDDNTGVYYRTYNFKNSTLNSVQVNACQVEYGADGSILNVSYSNKTKTGKEVNKEEVVNNVINDIIAQQSSAENE